MDPTTKLLAFRHLKERNIANNRTQLGRLISKHGFPRGFLLAPNSRRWTEAEVTAWLAQRAAIGAAPESSASADKAA